MRGQDFLAPWCTERGGRAAGCVFASLLLVNRGSLQPQRVKAGVQIEEEWEGREVVEEERRCVKDQGQSCELEEMNDEEVK